VSSLIQEHQRYLSDRHRLSAYARALREVVKPGDVVIDLASGTGILGMLACRAGARRVYAIEAGPIVGLARRIARDNGFGDRVVAVRGVSCDVTLPEPADVVVTDQIGPFGLDGGIIELLRDARARLLKPAGTLVPARIDVVAAPVEAPRIMRRIRFWSSGPAGVDVGAAVELAANSVYAIKLDPAQLLGSPGVVTSIDLGAEAAPLVSGAVRLIVERVGVLHGLCGWFEARLSPRVTMTNAPCARESIRRRQVLLPLREPATVKPGDRIDAVIRIRPDDLTCSWEVTIARGEASIPMRHNTLAGLPLSREDLRRSAPGHAPHLTPGGQARLLVLKMCDGRFTVDEIERSVRERFPDRFSTPSRAAAFVAGVLAEDTGGGD
jgi:protein arginine N-methyltransferase 1